MASYRGLNVQKALNDVDNKAQSLINLGLDQRDLSLIRGVTAEGITINELHTLSGLVVDQKKTLFSLSESSETIGNILTGLSDIQVPQAYNVQYDNQVRASAIKYNYLDFAKYGLPTEEQSADISTSRVSSWSTIGNSILYGGEIKVIGSQIELSSLKATTAPVAKLFRSEIPTHTLKLNINGSPQTFLAMKGIPIELQGFFRNAFLSHAVNGVNDSLGEVPGTWRIVNNDNGQTYNSGDGTAAPNNQNYGVGALDNPSTYPFRDGSSRSRTVQFYYDPSRILHLKTPGINITEWTTSKLPALQRLDLSNNDLYVLPSFRGDATSKDGILTPGGLAPVLTHIVLTANNLSRARHADGTQIVATHQLNTLPTTLTHLTMDGVFSDSTAIDLLDYQDLQYMSMHTYYERNAQRRMTGGTVSPTVYTDVSSDKGIIEYRMYNQPYSQLADGVCTSNRLTTLYFPWCGTSAKQGGGDITIASPVIGTFLSYGNGHNVVSLNQRTSLVTYVQQYSSGGSTTAAKTINNKFSGCSGLKQLNFYASAVTGDIESAFDSLASLTYLELRWTSLTGRLDDNSFANTNSLQHLLLAGSSFNTADFFGTQDSIDNNSGSGEVFKNTLDLRWMYLYNNSNVRGNLPDFSSNINLTGLYFHSTGINGPLQTFASNINLYYLRMSNCQISGSVPAFTGNRLHYIYLYSNLLAGQVPKFTTPYLYQLYLQYNSLTGNIPDLSGCTRLQRVYLNNNSINGYTEGSLRYNTSLSVIDFSNNQLSNNDGSNIIADLYENFNLNPRSGVSVNLLGNSMTKDGIQRDGTEGLTSTANKLSFLETYWTILI
tara:strand:+ start:7017 stop:9506 length:2490 start_codon:yes stop_codon:yes gene_type:complete